MNITAASGGRRPHLGFPMAALLGVGAQIVEKRLFGAIKAHEIVTVFLGQNGAKRPTSNLESHEPQ